MKSKINREGEEGMVVDQYWDDIDRERLIVGIEIVEFEENKLMAILKVNKLTIVDTPTQGTKGSAGIDLYMPQDVIVPANARGVFVHLGLAIEVPKGHYVELLPRSSTGIRTPIRIANEAGIIDSDYRGEICAICDNLSDSNFTLKKGERYFQLIVHKHHCDSVQAVNELSDTERGASGFGSTGD